MKEYQGTSAKNYQQTGSKVHLVIPAVKRAIPHAVNADAKLLDAGCGNGDLFNLSQEKGYQFYGFDISADMVNRAKAEYPDGKYVVASASDFAQHYNKKFEVILAITLLQALTSLEDLRRFFIEAAQVLSDDGTIIVGIPHPAFDGYMQHGVLGRTEDIETEFEGYFVSPKLYKVKNTFNGQDFVFEDNHYLLMDYFNLVKEAGLYISNIDECKPDFSTGADEQYVKERSVFPRFMVFSCKKLIV